MHVIRRFVTAMAAVIVPMIMLAACGSTQSTTNASWSSVLIVLVILGVIGLAYVVLKRTSQGTHQYGKPSRMDDNTSDWDGSDADGD